MMNAPWPSPMDSLPMGVDDPPNYHHRKLTGDRYPIVGSSPAERAMRNQDEKRLHMAAMRNHPFVGHGPYCGARISFAPMGGPDTGTITGWKGCGYSRDTHPEVPPEYVLPGGPADCQQATGYGQRGLCGDRSPHPAHQVDEGSLAPFWCTADQSQREPYRSEARRRA
jgi:hypothetical protein